MITLYVCSTNPGKLAEFSLASDESGLENVRIEPLPELKKIAAPEERGRTFEENAAAKAIYYSRFTSELVIADDSGLEVEELQGAPGVLSARYAGPEATDEENNKMLLRELRNQAHRAARFVCVVSLARAERVLTMVRGIAEGQILASSRGSGGFGYDPLFFYPPLQRSFGELTPDDKFFVSHRGNALRMLFARLPRILQREERQTP